MGEWGKQGEGVDREFQGTGKGDNIKKNVLKYKITLRWLPVELDKLDNGGKALVMRRDVASS